MSYFGLGVLGALAVGYFGLGVIICLAFRESDRDDQREELVVVLADAIKQAASSEHL
jgi:hypothetical protein